MPVSYVAQFIRESTILIHIQGGIAFKYLNKDVIPKVIINKFKLLHLFSPVLLFDLAAVADALQVFAVQSHQIIR